MKEVRIFCEQNFNVQLSLGTAFNSIKKVKRRIQDEAIEEIPPFEVEIIDEEFVKVDDEGTFSVYIVTDANENE